MGFFILYITFFFISLAYAEESLKARLNFWPAAIAIAILGLLSALGIVITLILNLAWGKPRESNTHIKPDLLVRQ